MRTWEDLFGLPPMHDIYNRFRIFEAGSSSNKAFVVYMLSIYDKMLNITPFLRKLLVPHVFHFGY